MDAYGGGADWDEALNDMYSNDAEEGGEGGIHRKPKKTRVPPKENKSVYQTTRLQKLMAKIGQGNGKTLALERGRTLITLKKGDEKRAASVTARNFDGIDRIDTMISYDKILIFEPDERSMASTFGNYQVSQIAQSMGVPSGGIRTYRPCPI